MSLEENCFPYRLRIWLRGLDVNKHIRNARIGLLDGSFHLVRNVMAFAHGDTAVYFNVEIDIKVQTHFSHQTFIDLDHPRNRGSRLADKIDNFAARCGVENIVQRGPEQTHADGGDDEANKNRGPVVRASPFFAADQGNRNSNKRSHGRENIGTMTPCVGFNGEAFDGTAKADYVTEESFFYGDDREKHRQSEGRRRAMWQRNCPSALYREQNRGRENTERDKNRGERFRFAVTVWMGGVRRSRGEA